MKIVSLLEQFKEKGLEATSEGISINNDNNELLLKGSKEDLIELANYILNVALSETDNDHLHLDNSTIINEYSSIKELIIEKDNKN